MVHLFSFLFFNLLFEDKIVTHFTYKLQIYLKIKYTGIGIRDFVYDSSAVYLSFVYFQYVAIISQFFKKYFKEDC